MDETIELTLESPDGLVDCRLEPQRTESGLSYSVTILYPNTVNGFSRSEIYCVNMRRDKSGSYVFEPGDDEVLPKIKKLEVQVSAVITGK